MPTFEPNWIWLRKNLCDNTDFKVCNWLPNLKFVFWIDLALSAFLVVFFVILDFKKCGNYKAFFWIRYCLFKVHPTKFLKNICYFSGNRNFINVVLKKFLLFKTDYIIFFNNCQCFIDKLVWKVESCWLPIIFSFSRKCF